MGFDYTLVHIKYTIPVGIALTLLYLPFFQRIDAYKILFLISIAVVSSTPWDSYLIRNQIWTYPPNTILGPKISLIPVEEVFFFIIQTYDTSLVYLISNRALFQPVFLSDKLETLSYKRNQLISRIIQVVIVILFILAAVLFIQAGSTTYLALILLWALPFVFLLWTLSSPFLLNLPYTSTLLPILLPTFYFWAVDTVALRKGTWLIASETKLNLYIWRGLDIEEAIFFLATNILIVFGLAAFDHSIAIIQTFPNLFKDSPELPSPLLLMKALLIKSHKFDVERVSGIKSAVGRLKRKSRSFYLASAFFSGRLRIDLILLYSFCRIADDLIDSSVTEDEAHLWISKLKIFLDLVYVVNQQENISQEQKGIQSYITDNFPHFTHSALQLLPTQYLSSKPLYDLLEGFKTDAEFLKPRHEKLAQGSPIADEHNLEVYAERVAGTIAELCLELVFHHSTNKISCPQKKRLLKAGRHMGVALQYVNISRDIKIDAKIRRVYLPGLWLKEVGLTCEKIIGEPSGPAIEELRGRLLGLAFTKYHEARHDMIELPPEARSSMRVAVESYMEIGRVLKEKEYCTKDERATVPVWRRLAVAWRAFKDSQYS